MFYYYILIITVSSILLWTIRANEQRVVSSPSDPEESFVTPFEGCECPPGYALLINFTDANAITSQCQQLCFNLTTPITICPTGGDVLCRGGRIINVTSTCSIASLLAESVCVIPNTQNTCGSYFIAAAGQYFCGNMVSAAGVDVGSCPSSIFSELNYQGVCMELFDLLCGVDVNFKAFFDIPCPVPPPCAFNNHCGSSSSSSSSSSGCDTDGLL